MVSKSDAFLQKYDLPEPSMEAFVYCHDHGCRERPVLSLTGADWDRIKGPLAEKANSPAEERGNLARAMAELEKIGGEATGTTADRARTAFDNDHQLDCIDESANALGLLLLLQQQGLIHHHRVEGVEGRGGAFEWPHFAASLKEVASGEVFAFDSWFHDNGAEAEVMPLPVWKAGWNPPGFD
ncbi:hypothetical protein GCM10007924_07440 [Sneathiella chinensis]|uniref:Uncharacterized protein n=1 Tax=Sneathiella chinensis TaxID=349750 RepID=A0ABQ5U2Q0_9PROT|nr:hypothetical protein GCM10007924_07440 [Sneathiella chinensis]